MFYLLSLVKHKWLFPGDSESEESACDARDQALTPGSGRSPGGRHGNPLVFLPGEFHGQRSLAGYGPWGPKESDTDWVTNIFTFI